jgi:hypothetical protein
MGHGSQPIERGRSILIEVDENKVDKSLIAESVETAA